MPNWTGIIIHHSATHDDGNNNDWEGIRRFHKSWRLCGEIISTNEGKHMLAKGRPVLRPWDDIGYHFGIEAAKGEVKIQEGRSLNKPGAHCVGMNFKAIGICFVGDFDRERPSLAHYVNGGQLIAKLLHQFPGITLEKVEPHNKYSNKTCPGNMFDMNELKKQVEISL